ncbi:MAG TPA: DUF501 domain-containing protein [Actinomycetota bacterium]|nr:DUF501 domain-containing protein [Actinomycetota bacterium]
MSELLGSDLPAVRDQLGREPVTPFTVVARCPGGHPLVIRNRPFDPRGHPFPTLFWLTCPEAVRALSRLESEGWIGRLNDRAREDQPFARELERAHREYALERTRNDPQGRSSGGVGGARAGIKCLHAHYANHLAGGADPVGAWAAARVEPVHPEERPGRVAAVDLGTNSIRLLVASQASGGGLEAFARDMLVTRIGQDVDRTGRIDPEALRRTVDVLARYSRRARALHAERIRVAATQAVREAGNREELERAVRELTGAELRILSGREEAALSFLGATGGLEQPAPYFVLDIGGGSTEFVVGSDRPHAAVSKRIGSVRLTERLVRDDPPSLAELTSMRQLVGRVLDEVEQDVPVQEARTMVAVAGTATTLRAVAADLTFYDPERIHRTWLSLVEVRAVLDRLRRMSTAERAALPVMAPGRADVIVAGAVVLAEVMHRFGFARALVSETDILEGLASELLTAR